VIVLMDGRLPLADLATRHSTPRDVWLGLSLRSLSRQLHTKCSNGANFKLSRLWPNL
jgi:hypothetical protein